VPHCETPANAAGALRRALAAKYKTSPTALRAALMRLVRVESETSRPAQTDAMNALAVLHQDQEV